MPLDLDFRNTNTLWCSVVAETLARCGVRHAVISPGSRSTPLTMAFVRHAGMEAISVLDERSAGFFALGLAKRTHEPVVLVCTSGTAVANYLPAVIEAAESGDPLLVLTADRPPEMRACASGQTIDQLKIFGDYVRSFHELAVPEPRLEMLQYLRQTSAHATQHSLLPAPGPVHLNFPFRDPLAPVGDQTTGHLAGAIDEDFFSHLERIEPSTPVGRVWQRPTTTRGLIVAGPANPRDREAYAAAIARCANGLGWPVLADALSPMRHYGELRVPVVAHYDAILRGRRAAEALVPRTVLVMGDWPTSKVLRGWLSGTRAEILMFAGHGMNRDALHGRTRHLPFRPEQVEAEGSPVADAAYTQAWAAAERAAAGAIAQWLQGDGSFEPRATWLLAEHLPPGRAIFVASSMPVRDVEYFWPGNDRRRAFYFSRGANGIDGTLSTALGVAHGGQPTVLLTGDLAFLHDSNGLLLSRKLRGSLLVVMINNRGGGIFEHLPVAGFDPPFEEFFATPQEVDHAALCRAHGVGHRVIDGWQVFIEAVKREAEPGIKVLEIRADRKKDAAARKRLLAEAGRRAAEAMD